MSVAIRAITRLQDADDVNVTPGVGVDEYVLTYDHDTAKFVLRAMAAPDLSGYALLAGRAGGQTLYGGTGANDDITIHGTSDATRTTSYVILQPTAGNVGIGTAAPAYKLTVEQGNSVAVTAGLSIQNTISTGPTVQDYGHLYVSDADVFSIQSGDQGTYRTLALNPLGGNVGIGTTAPNSKLEVSGTGAVFLTVASTDYKTPYLVLQRGTASDAYVDWQIYNDENTGNLVLGTSVSSSGTPRVAISMTGLVGIGTTAPATMLHAVSTTATTNAVRNVLALGANVTSTGVGAAGLGSAILFQGETSTTVDSDMAQIGALWTTATHATRASALTFSTLTAGGALAERVRIDGAGKVGIGAVTPLQKLHVAGDAVFDGSSASPSQLYLTGSTTTLKRLMIGYDTTSDFGFIQSVYSGSDNTFLLLNPSGGSVGIGTTVPGTLIHGLLTSAATNTVTNVLTIGHDTSGTAAAGFGAGLLFRVESSTTAASPAARIRALWYEATHATRKGDLVLTAYDTAEREGLRIRGDGSAPAIGFLGATPQARIAHVADPAGGATVDAEARTAINSILSTLELFGFHAVA